MVLPLKSRERLPYGYWGARSFRVGMAALAKTKVSLPVLAPPKDEILQRMSMFVLGGPGIGGWLSASTTPNLVFDRLARLARDPLSLAQFAQLLVLGHQAPPSEDFLTYYWLIIPTDHPYPISSLSDFKPEFSNNTIKSLEHLSWGLARLYADSLLWWGNVRAAYLELRDLNADHLRELFRSKRWDTDRMIRRGPPLPVHAIPKDNRYLISEMACKCYGGAPTIQSDMERALLAALDDHQRRIGGKVTIKKLIEGTYADRQTEFMFSADDLLEEQVSSPEELRKKMASIAAVFSEARQKALDNTKNYLSQVGDLDVYVATSMRTRDDFRKMADLTESIFGDPRLKPLNFRYFDPTLSAAQGHEDKGLIECLMVKCCKALIYIAGDKDSYGKCAEAAMALSLGKPVIFLCDRQERLRFYKDVHPLSRLIEFDTGVAVGAFATDKAEHVSELLHRIFSNTMQFKLEKTDLGYLRLRECLTDSVMRLQTNDVLLSETFWNHYHRPHGCR